QQIAVERVELVVEAVGCDPAVQLPAIIGTGEIRWLVTSGRSEDSRIQIHRFPPSVIRFKSKPAADALRQRDIQRMVVRGTLIEPFSAVTDVGVRARTWRVVQRAFRHQDPLTDGNRVAILIRAAADAYLRVLA